MVSVPVGPQFHSSSASETAGCETEARGICGTAGTDPKPVELEVDSVVAAARAEATGLDTSNPDVRSTGFGEVTKAASRGTCTEYVACEGSGGTELTLTSSEGLVRYMAVPVSTGLTNGFTT